MSKICRSTEEDNNWSRPLVCSRDSLLDAIVEFSFYWWSQWIWIVPKDPLLHPINWDQRYFLILVFIDIYPLSLCKYDCSRRSSAASKWLRSMLSLDSVILEVNSFPPTGELLSSNALLLLLLRYSLALLQIHFRYSVYFHCVYLNLK